MQEETATFTETRRNVAGLDIAGHADHYACGPRRDDGGHDVEHFGTTTGELRRMLAWLKERKVESVAMESTSVYWIPAADLLESEGVEVVLVDTREVRMVPGRKSDVKDCQWLQRLHSCGLLRGAFRPPESITAVRTLLREKENLTAARIQWVQQMQKSCDLMNIRIHHAVSDIDGKTGLAIVAAIVEGQRDPAELAKLRDKRCKKNEKQIAAELTGTWREEHLFNLEQGYRMLLFTDAQIALYDGKVTEMYRRIADGSGRPRKPPAESGAGKPSGKAARDREGKADLERIAGFDMTVIPGIGYSRRLSRCKPLTMNAVGSRMGPLLALAGRFWPPKRPSKRWMGRHALGRARASRHLLEGHADPLTHRCHESRFLLRSAAERDACRKLTGL